MDDATLRQRLTDFAARDMYQREGVYEQPGCPWDELFQFEHRKWRETVTPTIDALLPVIREALAEADDAGWDAAVHHLTNGDATIFRPADHPNPWRES